MSNPPNLQQLQRVVPIMVSRELSRGTLTCVALELYEDGAWLNSWIRYQDDGFPEQLPFLEASAIDDLGNQYIGWLGGGYGGDSILRFGHPLSPAIAPDARSLKIQLWIREARGGPFSRTEPMVWYADPEQREPAADGPDHAVVSVSLT